MTSCNFACDYDTWPEFVVEKLLHARKRWRCFECWMWIDPGDLYCRVAGKWEGEISTYRQCIHCHALKEELRTNCGCFGYGNIHEDFRNWSNEIGWGNMPKTARSLWYMWAREKVKARRK